MANLENTTASVESTSEYASGLSAIGIDGGFLLAQIVNFFLLFFILRAVLYKPILKILNERKKTIEDSLELAEETRLKAESASSETKAMLAEARIEAKDIVENARQRAIEIASEIEQKSKLDAETLAKKTRDLLIEERVAIVASAEKEIALLVTKSLEKLLQNQRIDFSDKELEEALSSAKDNK